MSRRARAECAGDLAIEKWPTDRLRPMVGNARVHSRAQVAQIAASIEAFGFGAPILASQDGDIISGHGRWMAAKRLQLPTVPVVVLHHLDELQRRALALADNRIAENSGWDRNLLGAELSALDRNAQDLQLTGFSLMEIDRILGESRTTEDGDALPTEVVPPVSALGDVWILGEHTLICGDSTDGAVISRLLGNEHAAMTFTDPPYNVEYSQSAADRKSGRCRPILNDALGGDFAEFLSTVCHTLVERTDGAIYIAMGSTDLATLHGAFIGAGGHFSTYIIWAKDRFALGRSHYHHQFEPILYGSRKGVAPYFGGGRNQGDLWTVPRPLRADLHPTMKPLELVARAIRNSSREAEIVLDPFGGSGSTLIACEQTRRCARLVELDPHYCDVICKRWEMMTGGTATRAI